MACNTISATCRMVRWRRDLRLSCHRSLLCCLLAEIVTLSVPCALAKVLVMFHFHPCKIKSYWYKREAWVLLPLHYSVHHFERTCCHGWYCPLGTLFQAQIDYVLLPFSWHSQFLSHAQYPCYPTCSIHSRNQPWSSLIVVEWEMHECQMRSRSSVEFSTVVE